MVVIYEAGIMASQRYWRCSIFVGLLAKEMPDPEKCAKEMPDPRKCEKEMQNPRKCAKEMPDPEKCAKEMPDPGKCAKEMLKHKTRKRQTDQCWEIDTANSQSRNLIDSFM